MSNFPTILTVSNYREMLTKLAVYFWIFSSVTLYFLLPQVAWLKPIDDFARELGRGLGDLPWFDWTTAPAVVLGFLLALIANSIKLHDLISNAFLIRERFEFDCIVWPMVSRCGVTVRAEKVQAFVGARTQIMQNCFYKYASSTDNAPVVSRHDIEQALTNWSWIWITLEVRLLFWSAALIAATAEAWQMSFGFAIAAGIAELLSHAFKLDARKYALSQVNKITSDTDRRAAIQSYLEAL